ncbi:MAG: CpaF family protein, partial [Planctomycetota bacterium]
NALAIPRALKKRIHERLLQSMDLKRADFSKSSDKELYVKTTQTARGILESLDAEIPPEVSRERLLKDVLDDALGYGPIEDLLADPEIDEIMVNNFDRIYVERRGKIERTNASFMDAPHLMTVIRRILSPIGRRVDESSPMVDARLSDGSRVNVIIPPLAVSGSTVTIRKFARTPFQMEDLVRLNALSRPMADFLRFCVENRRSLCISGGTGSGKTTFLNVLAGFVPPGERIVTIEDAAELRLPQDHVVSLESKPPNLEGTGAVTIRQLVINALRMRPDRIVVGECRGGEALDMLQAMNTGHEGSMTTVHANSPRDVLSRLETMVMMAGVELPLRAIRDQVASALDLIVHQARQTDGTRKVIQISAVTGMEGDVITLQEVFSFVQTGVGPGGAVAGAFRATGMIPKFVHDLRARGNPIDIGIFRT